LRGVEWVFEKTPWEGRENERRDVKNVLSGGKKEKNLKMRVQREHSQSWGKRGKKPNKGKARGTREEQLQKTIGCPGIIQKKRRKGA